VERKNFRAGRNTSGGQLSCASGKNRFTGTRQTVPGRKCGSFAPGETQGQNPGQTDKDRQIGRKAEQTGAERQAIAKSITGRMPPSTGSE